MGKFSADSWQDIIHLPQKLDPSFERVLEGQFVAFFGDFEYILNSIKETRKG